MGGREAVAVIQPAVMPFRAAVDQLLMPFRPEAELRPRALRVLPPEAQAKHDLRPAGHCPERIAIALFS